MENKIDKKAAQLGWKHLVAAYRTSLGEGKEDAEYLPKDIYLRFLSSGTEEKGSYSYLFAEYGKKGKFKIGFNFGDLILPGILDLTFNANASLERRKVLLPLIHRTFAKKLQSTNNLNRTKWTTEKPISFLVLLGKYYIGECGAKVEVGVHTPTTDFDAVDIGMKAGIGASLGGQFSAHFYKTQDDTPGSYYSGMDSDLQQDFFSVFGDEELTIIEEFAKWYAENERLKELINKIPGSKIFPKLRNKILKKISGNVILKDLLKRSKDEIIEYIDSLHTTLEADAFSMERAGNKELFEDALDKLKIFKDRLSTVKKKVEPHRPIHGLPEPGYCFLDVLGLSPQASAKLVVNVDAKALNAEGHAEAGAGITGMMKFSSSRLQNYARSQHRESRIVMTQDTVISYKQIILNANATANAKLKVPRLGIGGGKEKEWEEMLLNKMNYHSATSIWIPKSKQNNEYQLQMGSGVSFGLSVRFGALFEIAKSVAKKGDKENKAAAKIEAFSKSLKVDPEKFKLFISELFAADELEKESSDVYPELMGPGALYEYVLLESAYIFTQPPKLKRNEEGKNGKSGKRDSICDPIQGGSFKAVFESSSSFKAMKKHNLELESIRVRIRIADNLGNPEKSKIFHLGIKFRKTGLGFTLDSIKDFGNEGVFSMYTYFYENNLFKDETKNKKTESEKAMDRNNEERRENTIPPVFLPPHATHIAHEEEEGVEFLEKGEEGETEVTEAEQKQ